MADDISISALFTYKEVCKTVGARVRARRKHLRLSRKELSSKSGVSVPTITRFENEGVTSLGVVVKLAQALGSVESLEALFTAPKYRSLKEFVEGEQ